MARSGERSALTPSAATRRASMSRPESISSRMHTAGSNSAICKISLRFFSPPEIHGGDAGNFHRILERQEHALGGALVGRHFQQVLAPEQDFAAGDFIAR